VRDAGGCAWGSALIDGTSFSMAQEEPEAVLLVDDFPDWPVRLLRYQNRVRAVLAVFPDGGVGPTQARVDAPRALIEVLSSLAAPEHLPASALAELTPLLEAKYPAGALPGVGHGSFVFSILVELIPRHRLVLLQTIDLARLDPVAFCDDSPAADARLTGIATALRASLRGALAQHEVGFVNASFGYTLASVQSSAERACGARLPEALARRRLEQHRPLLEALFDTPGVFAANAAIAQPVEADFPFDGADAGFRGRVRVGAFSEPDAGLPAEGLAFEPRPTVWPPRPDADVWVNSGVEPVRPFRFGARALLQVDTFGTSAAPITQTTTSWVAPLALAVAASERRVRFAGVPRSPMLVEALLDAVGPPRCPTAGETRCRLQDPLAAGRTDDVRLGFRP
jgi:hypothetical protein